MQGYPERMRHKRRLYGIYTVCILIFTISATKTLPNVKLIIKKLYVRLNLTEQFNEFQVVFAGSYFFG